MNNGEYIRIHKPKVEKDNLVTYQITYPKSLRRYFSLNEFYIKYDTLIGEVPNDILAIPCLGSIITTAWALGSNVYVDSIDEDYLHSLNKIKSVFNRMYPGIDFKGEIYANEVVSNKFVNNRLGILFSGGLDSTSLYIQNRSKKPDLFTIIGGIIPSDSHRFIRKMKNVYEKFAQREKINLSFIESNVRILLNEALLSVMFAKKIYFRPWWEMINHGIIQLSLCAPVTVRKIASMKIALTAPFLRNYGADARIVGNLRWAGIDVAPDGYEYNRQEKIRFILKEFVKSHYHPKLQVCLYAPSVSDHLNCGYCDKCSQTIIGLIVEGIDPRKCGFRVHDDFFEHARKRVIPTSKTFKWERIQKHMPDNINYYSLSYGDFFDWFKNYDYGEQIKEPHIKSIINNMVSHIHARLPRRGKNIIMKFFYRARKKKHWLRP